MAHEVTGAHQGFLLVILEHNSGLWWPCGTKAPLQGGIETDPRPWRPSDDIHVCPSMRWQDVQEGYFGVMHGRFRQDIA
jgi:hypothetical protein